MLLFHLWKHNIKNMFRDGKNAALLMSLMLIQNMMYFLVWVVFFSKVSNVGGWRLPEVASLFAIMATGFGLIHFLFGGVADINRMVREGELDSFLARPKSLLLQLTARHHRVDAIGDIVTGFVTLWLFATPNEGDVPFLLFFTFTSALVVFGVILTAQSLAFWGAGKGMSDNIFSAWIIVANNPQNGFSAFAKLFFLIGFPTLYIGFLPIEIMRSFRWDYFFLQSVGSVAVFLLGFVVFNRGLKSYTSSNQFSQVR